MISTLEQKIQRIRELINKPIIKPIRLKNRAHWNQLCSCLDTIEDSELAIAAYSTEKFGRSDGKKYLALYGLLQALVLQQDAVFNLCESLEMPNQRSKYAKLRKIKDVRIASAGHPTKRNREEGQPTSHSFIVRITLEHDSFEFISSYDNGKEKFKRVSIPDLIEDQRNCLSEILDLVIKKLEDDEKTQKEGFKNEKLVSFFDNLDYHLGKVALSTEDRENAKFGAASLQIVKQKLQDFRQALAKRGIDSDTSGFIKDDFKLLEYPLSELEAFFQNMKNKKEPTINEKTAYIFAYFLKTQVDKLKLAAQEIDEDYAS